MQRNSLLVIDTEKDLDQIVLFLNLLNDGLNDIIFHNQIKQQDPESIKALLENMLVEQKTLFNKLTNDCLFTKGIKNEEFDLIKFLGTILDTHPNSEKLQKALQNVQHSIQNFKNYQKKIIIESDYISQTYDL